MSRKLFETELTCYGVLRTYSKRNIRYCWVADLEYKDGDLTTYKVGWTENFTELPKIGDKKGIKPFSNRKEWTVTQVSVYLAYPAK